MTQYLDSGQSSITKNNSKKSRLTKRFSSNPQVSTQTDSFSSPLLRHQLNTGKLNPFNMFHFFSESAFALPMGDGTIFGPITKNLSFIRRVFAVLLVPWKIEQKRKLTCFKVRIARAALETI